LYMQQITTRGVVYLYDRKLKSGGVGLSFSDVWTRPPSMNVKVIPDCCKSVADDEETELCFREWDRLVQCRGAFFNTSARSPVDTPWERLRWWWSNADCKREPFREAFTCCWRTSDDDFSDEVVDDTSDLIKRLPELFAEDDLGNLQSCLTWHKIKA